MLVPGPDCSLNGPAKAYDDVIEKYTLTSKVIKAVSDNVASMVKAFQVSLPQFILNKSDDEDNGYKKEQLFQGYLASSQLVQKGENLVIQ